MAMYISIFKYLLFYIYKMELKLTKFQNLIHIIRFQTCGF